MALQARKVSGAFEKRALGSTELKHTSRLYPFSLRETNGSFSTLILLFGGTKDAYDTTRSTLAV